MAKDFNKIQKPENGQDTKNGWEDVVDYAPDLSENTPEARLEARRRANLESLAAQGVHSDIFESGVLDKNELFQELLDLDQDEFKKRVLAYSDGRMRFSKEEVGDLEFNTYNDTYFQSATEKNYTISRGDSGVVSQMLDEYKSAYVHGPRVGGSRETELIQQKKEEVLQYKGNELIYKSTARGERTVNMGNSILLGGIPGTKTNKHINTRDDVVTIYRDENDRTMGNVTYTNIPVGSDRPFTARFSAPFHSEYPKNIDDMLIHSTILVPYFYKSFNEEQEK